MNLILREMQGNTLGVRWRYTEQYPQWHVPNMRTFILWQLYLMECWMFSQNDVCPWIVFCFFLLCDGNLLAVGGASSPNCELWTARRRPAFCLCPFCLTSMSCSACCYCAGILFLSIAKHKEYSGYSTASLLSPHVPLLGGSFVKDRDLRTRRV